MANTNETHKKGLPFPIQVGLALGFFGGLLSAGSFYIINYWPTPVSVAPYFGAETGFVWGAVVGFSFGTLLGFMCDDSHFPAQEV